VSASITYRFSRRSLSIVSILCLGLSACSVGPETGSQSPGSSNNEPEQSTPPVTTAPTPPDATNPPPATDTLLEITWEPNSENVAGYMVYHGPTSDTATVVATNFTIGSAGFNAQAPAASYYAKRDLNLAAGSTVCFRVRAYYSMTVLSDWSQAVCATV
jgi:hypothetical protein